MRETGERTAPASPAEGDRAAAAATDGVEGELLDRAERIADGDPAALQALQDLSEEDIADIAQLVFGLVADRRGKHWELPDRSARRIGRTWKRMIDRHNWEWIAKWLPDTVAVGLLVFEAWKRWKIDRELVAAKLERERRERGQATPAAA